MDNYVYTIPDINVKLITDNEGYILNMDSHNTLLNHMVVFYVTK